MNPRDIIFFRDYKFGHHRFYEVKSVCLGGAGQASIVELQSLTEKPGVDADGRTAETMLVPEPLLRDATIYTNPATARESEAARIAAEQRAHAAETALAKLRQVDAFMRDLGATT